MIVDSVTSPFEIETMSNDIFVQADSRAFFVGFPWKNMNITSRFVTLCDPEVMENTILNRNFQKLSESNLNFWDNKYDERWNQL